MEKVQSLRTVSVLAGFINTIHYYFSIKAALGQTAIAQNIVFWPLEGPADVPPCPGDLAHTEIFSCPHYARSVAENQKQQMQQWLLTPTWIFLIKAEQVDSFQKHYNVIPLHCSVTWKNGKTWK